MPKSRRHIDRLLNADEVELVGRSDIAALRGAAARDLRSLQSTLRERRDRARRLAGQQRREMRGKGDARGASPARDDAGMHGKSDVLTAALKRVGNELRRRRQAEKPARQSDLARKALALRQAAGPQTTKPDDRTPNEGMPNLPHTDQAPSGAFDEAGQHPAMQRAKFAR